MRLDMGRALLQMVLPSHEELSFQDVCDRVEKASSKLKLQMDVGHDGNKGRFLVAKEALKVGEVIISEVPLFDGNTEAEKSRQVYSEAFLEKLQDGDDDDFESEDCYHPRSPLMDCVAAVLLCKQQAKEKRDQSWEDAALKLRKFCALCRSPVEVSSEQQECVEDVFNALKPEMQQITSREEVGYMLQILSSNRFGHDSGHMQLMFAGSMFEHSCLPNCFLGTWSETKTDAPQCYRALRDIAPGEALSIDYLNFPAGYASASARSQVLAQWGFRCRCPRCVELPEIERSFVCPACGDASLCPPQPGSNELRCLSCERVADTTYAARCFEREAQLDDPTSPVAETLKKLQVASDEENVLGHRHHLVMQALWQDVDQGLPEEGDDLDTFQEMLEALIESLCSVTRSKEHPALLKLYHLAALSAKNDLELQQHYLQLEREMFQRFYPEEAQRQDDEIMALVKCNAPMEGYVDGFEMMD